jgi:metal-responsive CopG/Arc/MetJ family transcriptional regulator
MMPKEKVALTIEKNLLEILDILVSEGRFSSRSSAFEKAIEYSLEKVDHSRLARECSKLDPIFEQALTEEEINEIITS